MVNDVPIAILQNSGGDAGALACCIVPLILIVVVIIAVVVDSNKKQKAILEAHRAYQDSLSRLKSDPANPNLRQQTLQLGRVYSNLTRNRRGVTVFDEVALMNDINAACAGASSAQTGPLNSSTPSIEERLSRLSDLRARGLIDDEEYRLRRQQIINEV
ncbi:MAG TPA: SHOCT domain-containing protein [Pyrinomonadaceae bacterium]|nr:SHOCT domain-containing protein [Pyrinomonadaceae bacterium]